MPRRPLNFGIKPPRRPSQSRTYDRAWRKYSRAYLIRNALCGSRDGLEPTGHGCGRVQAVHVDHVVPMSEGGDKWDMHNHQSLCRRCHSVKTWRETRG